VFVTEHNPNHKGNVAELAIAKEAARLGLSVLMPLTEHECYDLALGVGGQLLRVQCKWARMDGNVVFINLTRSRRGPSGHIRSAYSSDEIDAVAAYCEELDECFLVPIELVDGHGSIQLRLKPARNSQRAALHFAEKYRLGAVAQLEERCRGTAEVGGSSPPSSISAKRGSNPFAFPARDDFSDLKQTVGMDEFDAKLAQYVRCAEAGQEVQVTRWGRPVARLAPPVP
jgi:prevent-host-death family protein